MFCACSVADSIDDILRIAPGKKPKAKPSSSSRSTAKPTTSSLFEDKDSGSGAAAMGTDDIMKYIAQQNQADDDDLDLF